MLERRVYGLVCAIERRVYRIGLCNREDWFIGLVCVVEWRVYRIGLCSREEGL